MDKRASCDVEEKDTVKLLKSMIKVLQTQKNSSSCEYFADKCDQFFSLTSDSISQPGEHLTLITQLLLILFEKLCDDYQLYEHYFLKFVEYCYLPLQTKRIYDILRYRDNIRDCFSACAYILGSTQNVAIIRKLLKLFIIKASPRKHYGFITNVITDCLVASKFAEIVSELLHITEFHLYFEYLSALEYILVTDLECREFLKYNAVDIISRRMLYDLRIGLQCTDEDLKKFPLPIHLDLSQRVLWLLLRAYLNSSPAYRESEILKISNEAWRIARNVLVILCYSPYKRRERNLFYLVFRFLWIQYPYTIYRRAINEVFYLGFITEVPCKDPNSWLSNMQFIPDNLDLEFKIYVISMLCSKQEVLFAAETVRFINAVPSLLIILDTSEEVIWTPPQREELMCYALLGLENVLPVVVTDFLVCKGPERLLQVIEQILSCSLPFHLLFPTLSCINKSLNIPDCDNYEIVKRYVDNNAVSLLTNLFRIYLQKPMLSKLCQNSLAAVFCILGKLAGERCIYNCDEVMNTCHMVLKKYLKQKASSGFLHPQLLLAIMTYLWECINCDVCDLHCFVSSGGIYTILDIIEQCPLAIKLIGLGTLCDFCGKNVTLSSLLTWRGKDGCTIIPFLLKLYRQQTIFDQQWSNLTSHVKEKSDMERSGWPFNLKGINSIYSSTVLLEIFGTSKPKICALLHILACSPQVNITNECYLISQTDISYVDEITAVAAEHYFNLKFGEAWADVEDYFRIVGCNPLVFDKVLLEYHVKQYNKLLESIHLQQMNYQLQDKVKETKLEQALYKRIQEQRLSESLDALEELKKIAMSSNRQFKVEEYNRMVEQLRKNEVKYCFDIHKTLLKTARVNIFHNKISVYSDIIIDPNPAKPLRQISSSDNFVKNIVVSMSTDVRSLHGTLDYLHYQIDTEDNIERTVDNK